LAVAIAALAAFLATRSEEERELVDFRQRLTAAFLVGLPLTVGSPVFIVLGVERVNPALAAMLLAGTPLITLLVDTLLLSRKRLGLGQSIGVGLGILGVGLVVAPLGDGDSSELLGVVFLFLATICWSAGLILTRRLSGVGGDGRFVFWQFLTGLPILVTLALILEGWRATWTTSLVLALLYSGALSKGLASVLQFRTVRRSTPLHSSLAAFLVPAVALLSTEILLDEPILLIQVFGGLTIGAAVTLVLMRAPVEPENTSDQSIKQ
jgi:drug/metabolite transporter (DMT)-like permease